MKKTILFVAAIVAVFLLSAKSANASYGCSDLGQYGGCPTPESIMIDKTVGKVISTGTNTATIQYVDNLSESDPKFKAGDFVLFQLHVKNTSGATESNVKVVDNVPAYLDPVEGPGTFDGNARTITFYIPTLNANSEQVFTLKMQVKPNDQLNSLNLGTCQNNTAVTSVDSASDDDSAMFCVTKTVTQSVLGVTQVPSTGPADWIYVTMGSIAALGTGIALKKKAK